MKLISHKSLSLYIVISCLIIGIVVWLFFINDKNNRSNVAITVNKKPVTVSEFQFWMLLSKANVYNQLYQKYNVRYQDNFWNQKIKNKKAIDVLRQTALDKALTYKVQQILASREGIPVIFNFNTLIKKKDSVNKVRKRKVKKGEVIYGPVQLTLRNFVSKTRDKMVQLTKNVLARDKFKVSHKKMRRAYKKYLSDHNDDHHVSSFGAFSNMYQYNYTSENYKKLIDQLIEKAHIQKNGSIFYNIRLP